MDLFKLEITRDSVKFPTYAGGRCLDSDLLKKNKNTKVSYFFLRHMLFNMVKLISYTNKNTDLNFSCIESLVRNTWIRNYVSDDL